MKLYVENLEEPKQKIYINHFAKTRRELYHSIGSFYFSIRVRRDNTSYWNLQYHINDVKAEPFNYNNKITGMIVGVIVGIIGGPLGILLGGFFGFLIGESMDVKEFEKAQTFNDSHFK